MIADLQSNRRMGSMCLVCECARLVASNISSSKYHREVLSATRFDIISIQSNPIKSNEIQRQSSFNGEQEIQEDVGAEGH